MTRELIMDALNRCEPYVIPECCVGCPYDGCWGTKEECITQLHADTYALLKTQEPRVMALSDVCNLKESTPVWLEDIDKKDVICALFIKDFGDTKCVGFSVPNKWYFKRITADYIDYGIRWRCWNQEPTDIQREAAPWQ